VDDSTLRGNGLRVAKASTAQVLRARLRSHNGSVMAASGATLVLVAISWALFYIVAYWLVMFVLTVAKAGDARLPASFDWVCASIAGTLLVVAAFDMWLFPSERAMDERPALSTITDVVLFVPRLTLTILLNFTAWARLPNDLQHDAAALIDRLRTDGKVALSILPLDLPDERGRGRILHVLQLLQIMEVRLEKEELWLRFHPLAPSEFRGQSIAEHAHDDVSRMRSAAVFKHKNALPSPKRQLPGHDGNHL
jgi:hypothetical protein